MDLPNANSTLGRRTQSVRPTRLGLHLIFIAIFTMVGGAIRGFDLLLILAGGLVGTLIIAWRFAKWFSRHIDIQRKIPDQVVAGTPFTVRYIVHNVSRWLPAWAVRIDDVVYEPSGGATDAICSLPLVPPRHRRSGSFECAIMQRGEYSFDRVLVSSSFPFALFSGRVRRISPASFLVLPKPFSMRAGWQNQLLAGADGATASAKGISITDGEFFGLREWQPGDNQKWIHHRTFARVGEPFVRQFERQKHFDSCLLVDGYGVENDEKSQFLFEDVIRFSATILVDLTNEASGNVCLSIASETSHFLHLNASTTARLDGMRMLAKAKSCQHPSLTDATRKIAESASRRRRLVVVSTRSMESAVQHDRALDELSDWAHLLSAWSQRSAITWINVQDPEFRSWVMPQQLAGSRMQPKSPADLPVNGTEPLSKTEGHDG